MKNYSCVLFKDKKDLTEAFKSQFPNAEIQGAYDKLDTVNPRIEILSVKFSKIGKKTFECYPNLKYIVCRSHGIDNVNLNFCKINNVEVVASYPTTQFVAEYIVHYLQALNAAEPILYFGWGNIAQYVNKLYPAKHFIINSKTSAEYIEKYIQDSSTIIVTSALCDETCKVINASFLENFKGKIISIARADVLNAKDLLHLININQIEYLVVDSIDNAYKDSLLSTGKVTITPHTAWSYNFDEEKYIETIKQYIDNCMEKL